MQATVSIDRTSLTLSALTISGDGSGTYSLTRGGLGRPVMTPRLTFMPDSMDVHGSEVLAAVKEMSGLPLEVIVQAATSAALDAALTALDDALWQFEYDVTVTVDGVAKTWHAHPAALNSTSGLVDHGFAAQFFEVVSFVIPVYPIAS